MQEVKKLQQANDVPVVHGMAEVEEYLVELIEVTAEDIKEANL